MVKVKWNDFNNLEEQSNDYGLISSGTIAKVRMAIKPGGYDDEYQNWTGGYATKSITTGAIYLDVEFTVLEGKYAKRKIWSLIGLHSNKGAGWSNMGRAFIKSIINSARGISAKDNTEQAVKARQIEKLADLNGIEFIAKIDTYVNQYGEQKNDIKVAITPDHKDYAAVMSNIAARQPSNVSNHPSWA